MTFNMIQDKDLKQSDLKKIEDRLAKLEIVAEVTVKAGDKKREVLKNLVKKVNTKLDEKILDQLIKPRKYAEELAGGK